MPAGSSKDAGTVGASATSGAFGTCIKVDMDATAQIQVGITDLLHGTDIGRNMCVRDVQGKN